MANESLIFEFVANQGQKMTLPSAWCRFDCADGFFRLADPPAVWAALRAQFSARDLAGSGLAVQSDRELALTSALRSPDGILFVARRPESRAPYDLIGESAVTRGWPAFSMMGDSRTQQWLEGYSQNLLVTFSLIDAAVLQSIGFPAVLGRGLDRLSGKSISYLRRCLGWPPHSLSAAEMQNAADFSVREPAQGIALTFVGWSLSELDASEPAQLATITNFFGNLQRYLKLDGDIGVWKPSAADIERIEFCARVGEPADVLLAIEESLSQSVVKLPRPSVRPHGQPTYQDAVARYLAPLPGLGDRNDHQRLWTTLQKLLEREVIGPLLKRGQETTNPIERNMIELLSGLSRVVHPHALRMARRAVLASAQGNTRQCPALQEELQQLLAMTDRTLNLMKELKR